PPPSLFPYTTLFRSFGDFAQVVRWNVGGHAHGDAGGAVDQEVRETGRKNGWFLVLAVVVVLEINGVLVDVADHFHGQRGHLGFGVTLGGGAIVARGTEVALAQSQRVAHDPVLDQAHQRIVDRGVAVRVVLAHDFADHAGALVVRTLRAVAAVVHRVKHAAVHWLQAIAHVRQRTADDHGHGVVKVRTLHFGLQVDLVNATTFMDRLDDLAVHWCVFRGLLVAQFLPLQVKKVFGGYLWWLGPVRYPGS